MVVAVLAAGALTAAEPPAGRLAASCGEAVVLVNPADGRTGEVAAGPVGWLYPAPGGVLFAPDLVHGRTTVISLAAMAATSRLEGVTMPRFARDVRDRYVVVVPGKVLVASYPDRAVVAQLRLPLARPWRAAQTPEGSLLVVLDRGGPGRGAAVVGVDLWQARVTAAVPLPGDPADVALLEDPLLVAVAAGGAVTLRDPGTLAEVSRLPGDGAVALAALPRGTLAVAADGPPRLELWRARERRGGLDTRRRRRVELPAPPVRLAASPDGAWLAVALASGELVVVDARRLRAVRTVRLPAAPRDLVWADPAAPGPDLPEWSG